MLLAPSIGSGWRHTDINSWTALQQKATDKSINSSEHCSACHGCFAISYSYFIKNQTTNVYDEKGVKHYKLNKHQLINERLKILYLHCGNTKLESLFLNE